jgi:L-lactate dehydrogenase complex protein LldE
MYGMPNVQLFITCLVDTFFPATGEAMVNVLQRCGVSVDFPFGQTCCGQPPFNAGLRADARSMAEHTIRVFENEPGEIVIPSGSCATMVRQSYLELFEGDPVWYPRAKSVASRTYEFTEYLVDVLKVTDVGARWDGKLAYHASCHLNRHLGIDRQPRALLAAVRGAEIVELPASDDCCGFGGVFSVEHPELSAEMLKRKVGNLEASGSPTLVLADTGCRMHIAGGLHRQGKPQKVLHIAEILNSR